MLDWIHNLADWMVGFASQTTGPLALGLLAFAESSFFPIPPDVLLIALALAKPTHALWFALICTLGSAAGGLFGYAIGRWGGRPVLERLVAPQTIQAIERQFQRYDVWAVGIAGFTPIPYKVFTIASGSFHLDPLRFAIVSLLSRGGRFFLVAGLMYFFGEEAKAFMQDYFEVVTIGFVVLLVGGFLAVKKLTEPIS